jgi:hypothetical protein
VSTVTVTLVDGPGNVAIRVESDPPLPLASGDLDVDRATPAQMAARLGIEAIVGAAAAAVIVTQQTK